MSTWLERKLTRSEAARDRTYPLGRRVVFVNPDTGESWPRPVARTGRVVGYGRESNLIRVKIEGQRMAQTWHVMFWRPDPEIARLTS